MVRLLPAGARGFSPSHWRGFPRKSCVSAMIDFVYFIFLYIVRNTSHHVNPPLPGLLYSNITSHHLSVADDMIRVFASVHGIMVACMVTHQLLLLRCMSWPAYLEKYYHHLLLHLYPPLNQCMDWSWASFSLCLSNTSTSSHCWFSLQ
jgi:hypothetical protein